MSQQTRVGVYVDAENIRLNGGFKLQYDTLREFACRGGGDPIRLNTYVTYDAERAHNDDLYRAGQDRFHAVLREYGYKVIRKELRWFFDEDGRRYGKANADLHMAVDALQQSDRLDRVLLVTGDGDFVQVVKALQDKGCRVELLAFDNVANILRQEVDLFTPGDLVPGMVKTRAEGDAPAWGKLGSVVRGLCSYYNDERGYGFMRFMKRIEPGLWITDTRDTRSPYDTAFFHVSDLPGNIAPEQLPDRRLIFEFDLAEGPPREDEGRNLVVRNLQLLRRL